ncbi:MAG: type I 3-dehydroquinate dehydratase, partial [Candidatus Thermoplasmatota archaeon]|nr:type I 3-dehydroquinate dehydratase [Candidatus Thermoplasmatota archaeon]
SLTGESTKVIASEHGGSPPSVDEILGQVEKMSSLGSIVKICYRLTTKGGALRVLEAAKAVGARENGPDIAIMGTGEGGDWTRIHAPILGSSLVYSTMEDSFDVIRQGRINFEDLYIAWDLLEYE